MKPARATQSLSFPLNAGRPACVHGGAGVEQTWLLGRRYEDQKVPR
jgi:hypothetical protein